LGRFPSGQRGQTVNLLAQPSKVQILLSPITSKIICTMNKNVNLTENLFYENGLRFECQKCSNCCRKSPGYVFLNNKDLKELKTALKMDIKSIIQDYCRIVDISGFKRLSLKEKTNYDCIFWENGGCIIYKHRPYQCRSYPFWRHNLESLDTWNSLKDECPGINKGKKHSKKTITNWMENREKQGFLAGKDVDQYFK
jgi:uncharacterized protein